PYSQPTPSSPYPLSLHDALPIYELEQAQSRLLAMWQDQQLISHRLLAYDTTNFYTWVASTNTRNTLAQRGHNKQGRHNLRQVGLDRKSTRLNSSHVAISYAVFCL